MSDPHYLLGHTDHELARLELQGTIYREITTRAFRDGGIRPGDRVLDVGCGTGDVSRTVAALVGANGFVLGLDRGATAIEAAREHLPPSATNTEFLVTELDDFTAVEPFDALVGRFILMHQPNPKHTVRSLLSSLRPGAAVVFIESWMEVLTTGGHSVPFSRQYDEIVAWKNEVVSGAGADTAAGGRLRSILVAAGVTDISCRLEALVAGGESSPYYEYVEQSVRSMLPEAARQSLAGFDEKSVEGMAERLREEAIRTSGSFTAWPVVVARGRLPA